MSDRKLLPGKFIWFDLVSSDAAKARAFYTELLDWRIRGFPVGDASYEMIFTGDSPDTMIGDLAPPPRAGEPSHWRACVSVTDVDTAVQTAVRHRGKLVEGPFEIPGVGRFARILDPQGAELCLLSRAAGDPPDVPAAHGRFVWNELHTTDPAAALAFYAAVVGFTHRSLDQGADGSYHILSSAGVDRGGVTHHLPRGASPHWLPYISVDDADAILARARPLGGAVLLGPHDIPGIGRFGVIADPTGAIFAVLEPLPRT